MLVHIASKHFDRATYDRHVKEIMLMMNDEILFINQTANPRDVASAKGNLLQRQTTP